jgi:hypothetical protein
MPTLTVDVFVGDHAWFSGQLTGTIPLLLDSVEPQGCFEILRIANIGRYEAFARPSVDPDAWVVPHAAKCRVPTPERSQGISVRLALDPVEPQASRAICGYAVHVYWG